MPGSDSGFLGWLELKWFGGRKGLWPWPARLRSSSTPARSTLRSGLGGQEDDLVGPLPMVLLSWPFRDLHLDFRKKSITTFGTRYSQLGSRLSCGPAFSVANQSKNRAWIALALNPMGDDSAPRNQTQVMEPPQRNGQNTTQGSLEHSEVSASCARQCLSGFAGLVGCLLLAHGASAQQSALNSQALVYMEYPTPASKVKQFKLDNFPEWATLDMQIRERGENQSSAGYVSGNDAVYDLTRIWGGLELRPTKWLTAYIQFVDAHALGLPLKYVSSNMRDAFDDRQAFLEFRAEHVRVIVGRQELRYGEERLVGISNWSNTSRTWDGFLVRIGDKNRLDLFSTSVVAIHPESLDKHGAGLTFHGAVATITSWVPHTVVLPFVYVKAFPRVKSQQGTYGTETELTPGVEISGKYLGGFYIETLGALQRGSYSSDSIRSAAGYVKAGYTAEHIKWMPRLTGEYKYASGSPNMTTSSTRIGTFDQQYPSNHNAFGMTDLFGYQNIKMDRIHLELAPAKRLSLLIEQGWLQVASVHDGVYGGAGSTIVKAPLGGFLSDDIGREFDATGQYVFLNSNLTLNFGIARFSPGALMQENAHGANLTEGHFGLTYKFKVNRKDRAP